MKWAPLLLGLVWLSGARVAHADVQRFALIIGSNQGATHEEPLRYAERDATRIYDVLTQLGDFSPVNTVLLRGLDATSVRNALIAINERVRDAMASRDRQTVLVIYYSGHADPEALHLGESELPVSELSQLARGSAASFRLVIVDACRSGSLTRVKGGRRVEAFALPPSGEAPLPGDGFAFLTASSAHEDAQESDELEGALFTHALISGLLGAADADGDGAVVLDEVYRYAYESTLRSTSRSFLGTQHPTFQYALRGRGHLVLTRPRQHAVARATVDFPPGLGFLLLRDSAHGSVAVELGREDKSRTLSLEPGRYFVRARAAEVMYEGMLDAAAGSSRALKLDRLERIDYARLVRKGAHEAAYAHGLFAAFAMRSTLPNSSTPCIGGTAGYQIDASRFGGRVRLGVCGAQLESPTLQGNVYAYDLQAQVYHAWDLRRFSLEVGVGGGLSLFDQRFETRGSAPPSRGLAPFTAIHAGAELHLARGVSLQLQLGGETYFLRMADRAGHEQLRVAFALRPSLGLGKQF